MRVFKFLGKIELFEKILVSKSYCVRIDIVMLKCFICFVIFFYGLKLFVNESFS